MRFRFNTPGVIRIPNERLVRDGGPHARFIRVSLDHAELPEDVEDKAVGLALDADEATKLLFEP